MKRFWGYFSISNTKLFSVKRLWLRVGVALVILSLSLPVISIRPVMASSAESHNAQFSATVEAITRNDSSPTKAGSVTWKVQFSAFIAGLTDENFTLIDDDNTLSGISILDVSPINYYEWTVTASTGAGSGTLKLRMNNDNNLFYNITNLPYTSIDTNSYEIDRDPPKIVSFIHENPASNQNPTNAPTLIFRAIFDERMDPDTVNPADFKVYSDPVMVLTPAIYIHRVSNGSGGFLKSRYDVELSGGDLATFNGIVGLDFDNLMDIQDEAGNSLAPGEPTPANDETYQVDHHAPKVMSVTSTKNGTYFTDALIDIKIMFDEHIDITGNGKSELNLQIGSNQRAVECSIGSDNMSLNCDYKVKNGDTTTTPTSNNPLDYVSVNSLDLKNNSLKDDWGNSASNVLLPVPGTPSSLNDLGHQIFINATEPIVTSVTATPGNPTTNGYYKAGATFEITLTFNKDVSVTGSPKLTLNTSPTHVLSHHFPENSDPTTTLVFTYTVADGDNTAVSTFLEALSLTYDGSIKGTDGPDPLNALRQLPKPGESGSLGVTSPLIIDTSQSTVVNVSSSKPDGSYKAGVAIPITVKFNEPIIITGAPQITLALASGIRSVDCVATDGDTSMATCIYTVLADDISSDLDYVSSGSLTTPEGSSITDLAGNSAGLTLANPSQPGSLGANNDLVIDTAAPPTPEVNFSENASFNHKVGLVGNFTRYHTPELKGIAEAGSTVGIKIYVFETSTPVKWSTTVNAANDGKWSTTTLVNAGLNLIDEHYTVEITATDLAQNTSSVASADFIVDATRPTNTKIDSQPDPIADNADFTFSATDENLDTFECILDNAQTFTECPAESTFPELKNGVHIFRKVRAKDKAGNVDDHPIPDQPYEWTLKRPPSVNRSSQPSDPSFTIYPKFEFSSAETSTTFVCSFDDGIKFIPCTSPQTYTELAGLPNPFGQHTFMVRAIDVNHNIGPTSSYTWVISDTKITPHPDWIQTATKATFNFSAFSLNGSDFECMLNGINDKFVSCKSRWDSPTLSAGTYTIRARAIKQGTNSYGKQVLIKDPSPDRYTWTIKPRERVNDRGFNVYTNGSKIPVGWIGSPTFTTWDGKDTLFKQEGPASVKMVGNGTIKTLTQTLYLTGLSGTKFNFSFYARGNAIPAAGASKCQAEVTLHRSVGSPFTKIVPCTSGTYGFTKKTVSFDAPWAFNKVVIKFTFGKASGVIWFDLVSLFG